jgi:hypothetical protein
LSPYQSLLFLVSVKNRDFGVTGLESRSVDSDSSGLCPVDSKSLW